MFDPYLRLLVGLGNPGKEYNQTRHNIGFVTIDHLIEEITSGSLRVYPDKESQIWNYRRKGTEIFVQKPLTYMNLSGKAVARLSKKKAISPTEILVIYDDVDLPLGKIRLRPRGSSGGHRGLESIITEMKTTGFNRLRIGVGRGDEGNSNAIDHVLENFSECELPLINKVVAIAVQAIFSSIRRGIVISMNTYNGVAIKIDEN